MAIKVNRKFRNNSNNSNNSNLAKNCKTGATRNSNKLPRQAAAKLLLQRNSNSSDKHEISKPETKQTNKTLGQVTKDKTAGLN